MKPFTKFYKGKGFMISYRSSQERTMEYPWPLLNLLMASRFMLGILNSRLQKLSSLKPLVSLWQGRDGIRKRL